MGSKQSDSKHEPDWPYSSVTKMTLCLYDHSVSNHNHDIPLEKNL